MNIVQSFEDLGINAIVGTNLMGLLNLHPQDLMIPGRFSKLQSVIDYLKRFPEDTQRFLVNKATNGKVVNRLDQVFEYVHLLKIKGEIDSEIDTVKKEISAFEGMGDFNALQESRIKENDLTSRLSTITKEIEIYEK